MGRGRGTEPKGEKEGPGSRGGYSLSYGDARGVLHEGQGESPAGPENPGPPGFPSLDDLKELNERIHGDAGTPEHYKLDQPSPLESCLTRDREAYSASPQGVVRTAALLAHGVAQAQAFRDGNRRTAYFATQSFLNANGYGHLSSETKSDHTLARYLNQVG